MRVLDDLNRIQNFLESRNQSMIVCPNEKSDPLFMVKIIIVYQLFGLSN